MELMRPSLTRWTAELVDQVQEQRFRSYNLRTQRRTAFATLVVILTANLLTFGYYFLGAHVAMTPWHITAQLGATAVGIGLLWGLARERRHTWLLYFVAGAVVLLTALIAVVIATGVGMGFHGAILVIGGVAVIYLTVPLNLVGVTGCALLYSAVTIPLWLPTVAPGGDVDVAYTLMATVVAHVLSFIEARRAQRERRVLFAQRETLLAMSAVDPLTGLMNRRSVDLELHRAWAYWKRTSTPLSVLMIDIDHFKALNDSQGHVAGDHALRLVADLVRGAMPMVPGQVAGRYGGEEFICLLPGLPISEATVVAGKILSSVRHIAIPLTATPGGRAILTVSIGVASATPGMAQPEDLIAAADGQLYRAKNDGRNCVRAAPTGFPRQVKRRVIA
ncbi:MAG: hypothetical protein BGO26_09770 [Actinobacteria bacterium 69-20]|nr:MAG: hypothetical protein BGO26_09770 [Actinobacteria bacterium 69-20]